MKPKSKTPSKKPSKSNVPTILIGDSGEGGYIPAVEPKPKSKKVPKPAPAPATSDAGRDGFGGRKGTKSSMVNCAVLAAGAKGATVAEIAPQIPNMKPMDISVQLSWLFIKKPDLVRREPNEGGAGYRYYAKAAGRPAGKPATGDRKGGAAVRTRIGAGDSV